MELSKLVRSTSNRIMSEFRKLSHSSMKPMITQFYSMDIYSDIHPFKETAIFCGPESDPAENRYINANRICSIYGEDAQENLIIAAQGPIDSSLRNFWKMVH